MIRNCKNDRFRYICDHTVFLDSQGKITDLVKKTYEEYCGVRQGIKMNHLLPIFAAKTCMKN